MGELEGDGTGSRKVGVLSVVLGFAGIIAAWAGLGEDAWIGVLAGVVLAVLAVILGLVGLRGPRGRILAVIGLILGILGLPWAGLMAIGVAFDDAAALEQEIAGHS